CGKLAGRRCVRQMAERIGARIPEVEALGTVAPEAADNLVLRPRLDSLGDQVQPERISEVDDPFQQYEIGVTGGDRVGEASVDLHDVDREALQVRERRVAGAEIVERQGDAARL